MNKRKNISLVILTVLSLCLRTACVCCEEGNAGYRDVGFGR